MFPFIFLGAAGLFFAYQVYREQTTKWFVKNTQVKAKTDLYSIDIAPHFHDGIISRTVDGIQIIVENLSDDDLVIDWANTLYISNGSTDGHFVFGGKQLSMQISAPRAPDVVFPKTKMSKVIKPASNIQEYNIPPMGRYGYVAGRQIYAPPLKAGEHGVHIHLKQNEHVMKESLLFSIDRVPRNFQDPPESLVDA